MKYFTVLILMLTSLNSYSQEHVQYFKKNNLKVNISSIVLKTYSTSFERMISNRVSVQIGYSKNLYNNFFKTSIGEKLVSIAGLEEDYEKYYSDYKTGNYSFTGEIKVYLSNEKPMQGLYCGVYGRYTRIDLDNINFTFETSNGDGFNVPLINNLKGFGGGFLLGVQCLIKERITLDFYILGAHYGKLNGSLKSNKDLSGLTDSDKMELKQDIEDFKILSKNYVTVDVYDDGLNGKINGPFFGTRAGGINIGFRF